MKIGFAFIPTHSSPLRVHATPWRALEYAKGEELVLAVSDCADGTRVRVISRVNARSMLLDFTIYWLSWAKVFSWEERGHRANQEYEYYISEGRASAAPWDAAYSSALGVMHPSSLFDYDDGSEYAAMCVSISKKIDTDMQDRAARLLGLAQEGGVA